MIRNFFQNFCYQILEFFSISTSLKKVFFGTENKDPYSQQSRIKRWVFFWICRKLLTVNKEEPSVNLEHYVSRSNSLNQPQTNLILNWILIRIYVFIPWDFFTDGKQERILNNFWLPFFSSSSDVFQSTLKFH